MTLGQITEKQAIRLCQSFNSMRRSQCTLRASNSASNADSNGIGRLAVVFNLLTAQQFKHCLEMFWPRNVVCLSVTRDVKVSRPAWSRDHFFGLGLSLTVIIGLDLGLGLMRYWSRVSYVLVSWSQSDHLLS